METIDPSQFLYTEKYRPQRIADCILPEHVKQTFQEFIAKGELPNMLLCGSAGTGKTTIARALCNEIQADVLFINASEESGIDTLRTKVKQFASSVSLSDSHKVVIMDEFDYSNANSTQPAFRGMLEEFSKNCRFILTCNFRNRIIEPLQSRCTVIDFKIQAADRQRLMVDFFKRAAEILNAEGIQFENNAVAMLIQKHFPDFRRVLNELQRYSASGSIDAGILTNMDEKSIQDLFGILVEKDFTKLRKWIAAQPDLDSTGLFKQVFEGTIKHLAPACLPQVVLILAEYQYKESFAADKELNILAALTEIMAIAKGIA